MPYDYKKNVKCKQSSGETGHYKVKRKGSKKPKCYKDKAAFERSRKYKYWAGIEEKDLIKKENSEVNKKDIVILENYIRKILESMGRRIIHSNAPLTVEEEKKLRVAEIWLMDCVVDGDYDALPPEIQEIEQKTEALSPSEARTLLAWFYTTAPGDFS